MYNSSRTDEFIHFWISFFSEFGNIAVSLGNSRTDPRNDRGTDVAHSFETSHFIFDGRFSSQKIRLMCAQSFCVESQSLCQGCEFRCELLMDPGV